MPEDSPVRNGKAERSENGLNHENSAGTQSDVSDCFP